MNLAFRLPNTIAVFLFLLSGLIAPMPLQANDNGGGGGSPAPLVFTVNLGPSNYLQIGLILEAATPEASHELGVFQPKIKHEIILLLSGKDEAALRTLPGKKALIKEIIASVNHVIHENEKTGVTDALLSNFIIQ